MSLKTFHILFVSCAVLSSLTMTWWAVVQLKERGGAGFVVAALTSFALAAGLTVYEINFIKKTKDLT